MFTKLSPLLIESGPSPRKNADPIRRHAEGLARDIQNDVMAKQDEVADAIERGIRRFAGRCKEKTHRDTVLQCVRPKHHPGTHLAQCGKRWRS